MAEFENPNVAGIPTAAEAGVEDITMPPQRSPEEEIVSAFDVNSLTLGEVAAVENFADASIGALSDPTARKGLLLQGLAWAIKHRKDPRYTLAMASTVTFGEIQKLLSGSEGEAPSD